uniref:Uncharacterized protein n=1 Tax=Oryza meridionalis TaxID=40149 RepID=A0A0E0F4M3_9ORYZ
MISSHAPTTQTGGRGSRSRAVAVEPEATDGRLLAPQRFAWCSQLSICARFSNHGNPGPLDRPAVIVTGAIVRDDGSHPGAVLPPLLRDGAEVAWEHANYQYVVAHR